MTENYIATDEPPDPTSFLRVDPTEPEHAERLATALLTALDRVNDANKMLLAARYELLQAGYRSSHPVCEDIDRVVRHLALCVEADRRTPNTWVPLWIGS